MLSPDVATLFSEEQRPLRRREYDALVRLGCFDAERVELLYGRIVPMSPQGVGHGEALRRLTKLLVRAVGDQAEVQIQSPIVAIDESEPEPDVAIVPPGPYTTDHPANPWLVIEVAESSLKRDRLKADLYAASRIPEYWLVDLSARSVVVYSEPLEGSYRRVNSFGDGDQLTLTHFGDMKIPASAVLPPPAP